MFFHGAFRSAPFSKSPVSQAADAGRSTGIRSGHVHLREPRKRRSAQPAPYTARLLTLASPWTCTGTLLPTVVPLHSWPSPLYPQARAVPSVSKA